LNPIKVLAELARNRADAKFLCLPFRQLTKSGAIRYICRAFGGRPIRAAFLFRMRCAARDGLEQKANDKELGR
jgi:hypothetical protein